MSSGSVARARATGHSAAERQHLASAVDRIVRRMVALDRVEERRRAVALARHYRDEEGLSLAEIARRLGRAEATVKAYLYDPTGEKARTVKARYRGVCRGCGAPTAARGGKGDAYTYCKRSHPGAIERKWTRERVREAMRPGMPTTATHRPRMTGRCRTRADAGQTRSAGYTTQNGHPRARWARCTAAGRPPAPMRSRMPESPLRFASRACSLSVPAVHHATRASRRLPSASTRE